MSPSALMTHINKIYKSERLRGQRALLLKYHKPLPPHLVLRRDRILELLKLGRSPTAIAAEFHIQVASVERYFRDLRRRNQLPARQTRRRQIASLHTAGLSRQQIAQTLNITPQNVSTQLFILRQQNHLPPRPSKRHQLNSK